MPTIDLQTLAKAYAILGLQAGDVLLVHSDLRGFGIPSIAIPSRDAILQFYFDSLLAVIGPTGTLAVPAYFYEYARYGIPFDVDFSPVSTPLGALSQWINQLPERQRSCNPLQSIAAIGEQAIALAGSTSLSGYGVTSPWHKLRLMKGKILFLGAPLQAMTYVHYIEQHYGVPHLYFKIYPYPIIKGGKEVPGQAISAVRYLEFAIHYDLAFFQQELTRQGALRSTLVNGIPLLAVDAETAFSIGVECLEQNPYFFLRHPPQFIPGKIPYDGVTGTLIESS